MHPSTPSCKRGPGWLPAVVWKYRYEFAAILLVLDAAGIAFLAYALTHEDKIVTTLRYLLYGVKP